MKNRAKDHETGSAVPAEKLNRLERIDCAQHFRNPTDLMEPQNRDRQEPENRDGPEDAADSGRAARLKDEKRDQDPRSTTGTT